MNTSDLIEALRVDIQSHLEQRLMENLKPLIERKLYSNVFDVKEAAKYLAVSEATVRRMVADKAIPHFRQRGQIFFRQRDIEKWIDSLVRKNYGGEPDESDSKRSETDQ